MKKQTAALLAAAGMAVAPVLLAPAVHADVCGAVGGRHVAVGGCSHVVGDVAAGVALANDDDWAAQESSGQTPCYTPSGVPYYTPGADPASDHRDRRSPAIHLPSRSSTDTAARARISSS